MAETQLPDAIRIPLLNSSEKLDLSITDLKSNSPSVIIEMLEREHADLIYWLKIAMVYFYFGKTEDFVMMLEASLSK